MHPGAENLLDLAERLLPRDGSPTLVLAWPSREGPLMATLDAARGSLPAGGTLLACDLVWQTAPTLELLRAFNVAGREKVRPIEGYEMALEHHGFDIVARESIDRAHWARALAPEERAAVEADARGAAKLAVWLCRRVSDEEATTDE